MKRIRGSDELFYINQLRCEIKDNCHNLKKSTMKMKRPVVDSFVAFMKDDRYCFESEDAFNEALAKFFDDYTIKRLAERVYDADFGEKFTESYVSDEPIGSINDNGIYRDSYEMQITFCVLPWYEGERSSNGLPFMIVDIRLI